MNASSLATSLSLVKQLSSRVVWSDEAAPCNGNQRQTGKQVAE